ncbi:polysaccharide biosynthesis tyrosine autokinase [Candidatus Saccharibacteria bacterium]|nr:polysaccharide biosynthesis tyrosine autokinase [Candidatus Saccharibacteria bacterium]
MEEIDLKDFLSYLKKFVIVIIVVAIVAVAGTYFYDTTIKTPMYTTYTKILLVKNQDEDTNTSVNINDINANQKLAATYSEFVKSRLVLQQVIDELRLDYSVEQLAKNVSVTNITDTQILKISVTDANPERARDIADSTTKVFAKEIENITHFDNVRPYEAAQVNNTPSNNTLSRDLIIAALVGIFGVLAIVFIIYYFDDTVKYSEDLERKIGIPVIGKIIRSDVSTRRGRKPDELIVQRYPKSAVTESIKSLRTNLQFTNVDKGLHTILMTSSLASEGKSFVSSNLAISFAQSGRRTLIVDCDLRKGRLHHVFHLPNIQGLSHLLVDKAANFGRYIQKTSIDNLYIITRGTYPPNPSELLGSDKNRELINVLRQHFDIIIFDGAPCNGVTDSIVMSTLVDEVLIVTKNASTPRSALDTTRDMLAKVNAPIAGVVMNSVDKKVAKYYSYYGAKGARTESNDEQIGLERQRHINGYSTEAETATAPAHRAPVTAPEAKPELPRRETVAPAAPTRVAPARRTTTTSTVKAPATRNRTPRK